LKKKDKIESKMQKEKRGPDLKDQCWNLFHTKFQKKSNNSNTSPKTRSEGDGIAGKS